jgi:hypothetical protein
MIIPLYGIISHTRSMTQSRIRGILAGFNRGIKRPINLSAFTAHIRLNMDGLKYLVFHPSRVSPCLGSWAFQSLSGFQVRCNTALSCHILIREKSVSIPIGFSSSLQRLVLLWHELDQISFNPYRVFKFVATASPSGA